MSVDALINLCVLVSDACAEMTKWGLHGQTFWCLSGLQLVLPGNTWWGNAETGHYNNLNERNAHTKVSVSGISMEDSCKMLQECSCSFNRNSLLLHTLYWHIFDNDVCVCKQASRTHHIDYRLQQFCLLSPGIQCNSNWGKWTTGHLLTLSHELL